MIIDDIALTLQSGVNYATAAHLLEVFGSAEAIYAASAEELIERAWVKAEIAREITKKKFHRQAEQETTFAQKNGVEVIASTSPLYPRLLRECADYPHVLYVKGDPGIFSAPMLSMVGTRNINTYGLSACHRLVEGLARLMPDLVIVSGLAFGTDVACHRAAMTFGLRTLAVMATPINTIYPSAHSGVAADMVRKGGALVTELSSQDKPAKARFLQRNRIIAGMSPGTIVVQSPQSGGSMVTASIADSYDRCVMCPPANIGEKQSEGTNRLLRTMKARMVCSAEDVIEELGWTVQAAEPAAQNTLPPMDRNTKAVYDAVCSHPKITLEEIEASTGIGLQELLGILLELEFGGCLRSLPGNKYEKF